MQRTPRRDKGHIRLNPRDLTVLTWIGDQYAIRLDSLQVLLGRAAQQATKVEGQVSESTARQVIDRWKQEDLVATRKFFYREPEWIWLTANGLRQMDFPFKLWTPKVGLLPHFHLVNQVRLHTEQSYKHFCQWRGERLLRQEHRGDTKFHVPDGEVVTNSQEVIAIEVERTVKSRPRVHAISKNLSRQYQRIWYFVTPATRFVISEAVAEYQAEFRLYDLSKIAE